MKKLYHVVMIFWILTIAATGLPASEIISPLVVLPDPGAVIPDGSHIHVYSAPMIVGAVFHDSKTSDAYMLSVDSKQKKAMTTDSAGNARTYTDSDVLGGISMRDGTLYNGELIVVTDYYPDGGSYFQGVSTVLKDGSFRKWPLIHSHGGSGSITAGLKNSLFLPAGLPKELGLPVGLSAKMLRANYTFGPIGNLFFGPDGALYVFTSSRNRKTLARIEPDGTSSNAVKSDVLLGTHLRAGALYGDGYVVAVDYALNSGNNALSGIYTMAGDGTYTQWALSQGHSGISDLIPAPRGGYYFTDFENDNIWHITKPGENETPVLTNSPVALMSVAVNDSGNLAAVNWVPGEWWSNGGVNAIYRISGGTATLAAHAPEGSRLFSIAAGKGEVFGTSLLIHYCSFFVTQCCSLLSCNFVTC